MKSNNINHNIPFSTQYEIKHSGKILTMTANLVVQGGESGWLRQPFGAKRASIYPVTLRRWSRWASLQVPSRDLPICTGGLSQADLAEE